MLAQKCFNICARTDICVPIMIFLHLSTIVCRMSTPMVMVPYSVKYQYERKVEYKSTAEISSLC